MVSEMPTFSVTPGDFNVDDPIFVKWIVEFPPFVPNPGGTIDLRPDELPPSADGTPIRAPKTFSPNCNQVNNAVDTSHYGGDLQSSVRRPVLTTTSEVPPILVSWTWEHSCPQ